MDKLVSVFAIVIAMSVYFVNLSFKINDEHHEIITAIVDNGCASHQELSQTKSNADVYNYAALSTSY